MTVAAFGLSVGGGENLLRVARVAKANPRTRVVWSLIQICGSESTSMDHHKQLLLREYPQSSRPTPQLHLRPYHGSPSSVHRPCLQL